MVWNVVVTVGPGRAGVPHASNVIDATRCATLCAVTAVAPATVPVRSLSASLRRTPLSKLFAIDFHLRMQTLQIALHKLDVDFDVVIVVLFVVVRIHLIITERAIVRLQTRLGCSIAAQRATYDQKQMNAGADAERVGAEKQRAVTIRRLLTRHAQTGAGWPSHCQPRAQGKTRSAQRAQAALCGASCANQEWLACRRQ
jgi:hypothetical protein